MANRVITQVGAVVRSQDLLYTNKDATVGLGMALLALLGSGTYADGLACTPVGGNMQAQIGSGSLYQLAAVDSTAYGVLPSDSSQIAQQGILFGETPLTFTAPLTVGYSQDFLIEAQFQQVDSNPQVLNYYNAANPTMPLPGIATNTNRGGVVALQIKAGAAATTGAQTQPTADSGWIPLWIVTVAYGQTVIVSGNITIASGAPFIQTKLGGLFSIYAGNPNGHVAGIAGAVGSVMASMVWDTAESTLWFCTTTGNAAGAVWSRNSLMMVYAGNPNGYVAGNQGAGGGASPSMVFDSTESILWFCTTTGNAAGAVWSAVYQPNGIIWCGTSTGSANAQVLTPVPAIAAYSTGLAYSFVAGYTNTGATTIAISGLGTKNIFKDSPTGPIALTGGEIIAGNILTIRYDGTQFQLTATELGTASLANASSNTGIVAAVSGATVANNLAAFSDTAGTIKEGPVVSSASGVVAAVSGSGSITISNFAAFSDVAGTIADSGLSSVTANFNTALYQLGHLL